jgi:hypothetical protein
MPKKERQFSSVANDIPPGADCNRDGPVTLTCGARFGCIAECHTLRFSKFPQVQISAGDAIDGRLSVELFAERLNFDLAVPG